MPLPPHLETLTGRKSARQKHCAQRQCPSLQTARWLILVVTPGFRRHQLIKVFQRRKAGIARNSSLFWARIVFHLKTLASLGDCQ